MARVVIEHLSKIFRGAQGEPVPAVNDANLAVEDQELLVLVGPSGCGKSTTLRLIAGLERATHGSVFIEGRRMNDVPPRDRDLAMVFQHHALYPHLTVFDNLALGLRVRQFPRAEIQRRVAEAAEFLGLVSCLGRRPQALSGGQRQRVAVGRAIVRQPRVLLLDEPLSNLDAQLRVQLRAELVGLQARLGATMLYVTHDQVEAMTMGRRVAVMREGVIQQVARPLDIYRHPANLFVAGFVGSPPMNLFHGAIREHEGRLNFTASPGAGPEAIRVPVQPDHATRLAAWVGRETILGLRPEHITVQSPEPGTESAPAVRARLERIERLGPEAHLTLKAGANSLVARVPPEHWFEPGQPVTLHFDMRHALFFDPATGATSGTE